MPRHALTLLLIHTTALFALSGCDTQEQAPKTPSATLPVSSTTEQIVTPPIKEEPPEPSIDVEKYQANAEALGERLQKIQEAMPSLDAELTRCEGEQPEALIMSASQLAKLTASAVENPVESFADGSWRAEEFGTLSELLTLSETWDEARAKKFEALEGIFSTKPRVAVVQAVHVRQPSSRNSWEYSAGSARGRVLHFEESGELRCASYYEAWNSGTLTSKQGGLVGAAKSQLVQRVEESVKESFKENLVPPMIVASKDKGNLEGKIFYGSEPLVKHQVKLCTKFDPYWSGCGGKTYKARTDKYGRYVIKDLKPGVYEGLLMRDANNRGWIYTTGSFGIGNATITIKEGKTTFWGKTQSFKNVLKITSPKRNKTIPAQGAKFTWKEHPGTARYTLKVNEEFSMKRPTDYDYHYKTYDNIEGTEFEIPDTLHNKSKYKISLEAYDDHGNKLAELKVREFKVRVK